MPKKTITLLLSSLLVVLSANAQNGFPCGADFLQQGALQNPASFQQHLALEQEIYDHFKSIALHPDDNTAAAGRGNQVLTIPVVVHIIHDNGPENISDAAVQQAIQWLNQAYANEAYFDQGSGAVTGIQFCLAQRTPDSQPTNGITRDQNALTVFNAETQEGAMKNINRWKPKDYINIWVVRDVCSAVYGCGLVAYAYHPTFHGSNIDGIVIEANFLNSASNVSVLAHEIGHYFGLYHTFEGGCQNYDCLIAGDKVCDTPPDQSTAAVPCDQTVNTCSTDAQSGLTSDQPDMTWNHMDYGHLDCKHDFTQGQADRMIFFLNGARKSLLDSKGCLPPCPLPVLAAFTPGDTTIQAGETLFFDNNSQNAVIFSWALNGQPFGGQQNAAYTFNLAGVFTVQLVAQPLNAQLCDVASAQITVQVLCEATAGFTLGNLSPEEGQTVDVTNTSQQATQYEWFVDGVSQGSTLDSVVFGASGFHEIRLLATGANCSDELVQSVFVRDSCTEKTLAMHFVFADEDSVIREMQGSAALSDGSLVVAGSTNISPSSTGPSWIYLMKIDPEGGTQWIRDIGNDGSGFFTRCAAIAATPDGGFVAVLYRVPLLPDTLAANYLIKFTADGAVVWFYKLNESVNTGELYGDLAVAPNGDIYVDTKLKFDANGNILWSQAFPFYGETNTFSYPGGGMISLTTDAAGNAQIARLDAGANVLWCNNFDLGKTTLMDVAAAPDGSIFALGRRYTLSVAGAYHTVLLKLSPEGNILWSSRYYRTETTWFDPRTFTLTPNGGVTVAARSSAVIPPTSIQQYNALLHADAEGNVLWVRHVEEEQYLMDELFALPGGYLARCGFGWAKADPLGYVGNCESTPYNILREVVTTSSVAIPVAGIPVALNLQAGDLPVVAFSPALLTYDTSCAPACPRGVEICNNSLDDDEDGLFDCLDPDCNCPVDVCRPGNANIWYFGDKAGLDFNTEPPTVLTDNQLKNYYESATACDASGKLLFYTDGDTVFNRFHQPMPNATNLVNVAGSLNNETHAIIIPNPAVATQYYVFHTNHGSFGTFTSYSLIDMKLDNGRGDVVPGQKSISYHPSKIETEFTAVHSCAFDGYWLMVRGFLDDNFYAYKIAQNGLESNPVVSPGGANPSYNGQMKFSPNGRRLARNTQWPTLAEIYDFSPASGLVSNLVSIAIDGNDQGQTWGVEFSPDSRYLYVSAQNYNTGKYLLFQMDLEAGDADQIRNSIQILAEEPGNNAVFGPLQLAPDGKIYITNTTPLISGPYNGLHVIHQPNLPGVSCQLQLMGLPLTGTSGAQSGLVNVVQNLLADPVSVSLSSNGPDTICDLSLTYFYKAEIGCLLSDSVIWKLEGLSGTLGAAFFNALVSFDAPGEGDLIVTNYTQCGAQADTLHLVVAEPFNKILDLGPDRVVCDNGVFTFNAGSGFARYRWQNGAPDSVLTTLLPGLYWVDVWDACGNLQSDTVTVTFAPATVLDLGEDRQGCDDLSGTFQRPEFFSRWVWTPADFISCDTCASVAAAPASSTSWVVVAQTDDGCISVDTLTFSIQDTLFFQIDTSICVGQVLELYGSTLPADTSAHFFFPAPGAGCDTLISVQVSGIDAPIAHLEATICAGQSYDFNGSMLPADTTATFLFPGVGSGCDSAVVVSVTSWPPLALTLPPDTTLRIGAALALKAEAAGVAPLSFAWSPAGSLDCGDCAAPTATPDVTTLYRLTVSDANGCTAQDSVLVSVDPLCVVIIPNAFTPNGDGVNDRFFPKTDPCVHKVLQWRIASRWGETVFESRNATPNDPAYSWDGNRPDGTPFPSEVLVWYAELEYHDGRREARKGDVTLLR